jgi:dipeptidyl aminopeptidase/acylaminoacyl peptidase
MLRSIAATLLTVCGLAATPAQSAPTHPFDVRDLVAMDRVADPRLSPDGTQLVFQVREADVAANKASTGLWLRSMDRQGKARRITAAGVNSVAPRWAPDGRSLYFLSSRSGSMQVWRLDLAGGEARQASDFALDVGSFVLAPDGKRIALSFEVFAECAADLACTKKRLDDKAAGKASGQLFEQLFIRHWDTWADGRRSQLFVADLDAQGVASSTLVHVSRGIDGDVPSKPFGDDSEYSWRPDGGALAFSVRIAGRDEPWSTNFDIYLAPADGSEEPTNLTRANLAWDAGPLFSADSRTLYYRAMKRPGFEADRLAVMAMDLATRATREIAPGWDRSADSLLLSADGRSLYAVSNDLGHTPLFAIDIASGKVAKIVGDGSIGGVTLGKDAVVVVRDDLGAPAQLFRTGLRGGRLEVLTDFNAARLATIGFGAAEQFTFAGAEGATVHAWLVKPAGFDPAKKYPVAFLIHGGPQGSFGNHFHYRWNPQTYAGQGFAAVMVDFHGSTGYGQAFTDSISGDWGGKPLEDLDLGLAAALSKYSFLDRERVCALGGSYGGFMTNWIAGKRPGKFRCLVTHSGVFDARMMSYATEEQWFDQWERKGSPWEKPENFERDNPATLVGAWTTPMLVVHGQLDYRIPVEQGIAAFTALQGRKVPSQFLYFPDENHWILKPANSILWHDTVNAWLKRWLVDAPAR